ncbi:MAG: hypothetical protein ACHQJ6_00485 [Candidatus Berkiellales bacterium]
MIKPIQSSQFIVAIFSSASLITCATLYAILFAFAQLRKSDKLLILAYLSYVGLLLSVVSLSMAANFEGFWHILSIFLLLGYFFAPYAMLKLCLATHIDNELPIKGKYHE